MESMSRQRKRMADIRLLNIVKEKGKNLMKHIYLKFKKDLMSQWNSEV